MRLSRLLFCPVVILSFFLLGVSGITHAQEHETIVQDAPSDAGDEEKYPINPICHPKGDIPRIFECVQKVVIYTFAPYDDLPEPLLKPTIEKYVMKFAHEQVQPAEETIVVPSWHDAEKYMTDPAMLVIAADVDKSHDLEPPVVVLQILGIRRDLFPYSKTLAIPLDLSDSEISKRMDEYKPVVAKRSVLTSGR